MTKVKSKIEDIILNRLSGFYLSEGFIVKNINIEETCQKSVIVEITLYRVSYCCPVVFDKIEELTKATLSSNINNLGKVGIYYEGTYDRN